LVWRPVSALFFVQSNLANQRVDKIQAKLDDTRKILWAIKLTVMADSEIQKEALRQIFERLLEMPATGEELKKTQASKHKP